jgi:hypothetical protein
MKKNLISKLKKLFDSCEVFSEHGTNYRVIDVVSSIRMDGRTKFVTVTFEEVHNPLVMDFTLSDKELKEFKEAAKERLKEP